MVQVKDGGGLDQGGSWLRWREVDNTGSIMEAEPQGLLMPWEEAKGGNVSKRALTLSQRQLAKNTTSGSFSQRHGKVAKQVVLHP